MNRGEVVIEPFTRAHLEGLTALVGLQLAIRTRTEGYYERLGASRSLGFRLTRENLGLDGPHAE